MPRFTVPTITSGAAPSHAPPDTRYLPGYNSARLLGWFSIGLGLAELLAPKKISAVSGIESTGLLQLYGLREIGTGIGILTSAQPAKWVAARVAGDVVDLATLGVGISQSRGEERDAAVISAIAVAGVTALDCLCYAGLSTGESLEG